MPRGDRTGPNGKGPKTGRGLGPCPDTAPLEPLGGGRGFGRGRGRRVQ